MVECIYLCPMYNAQGGHLLFNLQTQAIITRTVGLVQLPITPTVCQMVTDLGVQQGITKLEIQDRHKKLIWDSSWLAGVDYDPWDEDNDPEFNPEEPFNEEEDEPLTGFEPIEEELEDEEDEEFNPAPAPERHVRWADQEAQGGMHVMDLK